MLVKSYSPCTLLIKKMYNANRNFSKRVSSAPILVTTRSMKKRVRDQEELFGNREERNFRSIFSALRHAFRVLVSTLNVKAFDEKKKVAKEEFMTWDVLEDVIPYLQREEIIFVTGGLGDRSEDRRELLNSIELYNTLTHQVELSKDTLRTARCDHTSVIVDGVLYIMGGTTTRQEDNKTRRQQILYDDQVLHAVEAYDTVYRCWLPPVPDMNIRRCNHCSVGLNDFVYVMGGMSHNRDGEVVLKHVERLNTKTLSWDICSPLLYARQRFVASVYLDKIYVVGGHGSSYGGRLVDAVERFDPAIGLWVEIYRIPIPLRLYVAALAPGIGPGSLLICGGRKNDGKAVADTKTLDLETQLITDRRHKLHVARSECAAVTSGDSVDVLGELDQPRNVIRGVESFGTEEGGWVQRSSLKEKRTGCSAACLE